MDLSTIRKKFDQKKYNFGREALADFETMFSNCYLYNKPTDDVTLMCQAVESYFKDLVKKMDAHDNLKVEVEVPLPIIYSFTEISDPIGPKEFWTQVGPVRGNCVLILYHCII